MIPLRATICIICIHAAGCASYRAAPLDPAATEVTFRARTLADSALHAFVVSNGYPENAPFPPAAFDLATLRLVSIYEHPEIAVATARLRQAEAAMITAGARPNPTMTLGPEYSFNPPSGDSPWILGGNLEFTIETGGKRDLRIEIAKRGFEVARLEASEAVWRVASRVRPAILDFHFSKYRVSQASDARNARERLVQMLEKRTAGGEGSRLELNIARMELSKAEVAETAANSDVATARLALAAALGVPDSAIQSFDFPDFFREEIPSAQDSSIDAVQRAGLLHRADVRRALAEYAVAETMLQLEVANQYPNVRLSPGYLFDQGQNKFTLGLSMDLPIFNKHEGPIAEACARRDVVAAEFLSIQSRAIAELEFAHTRLRGALQRAAAARRLVNIQSERERAVERQIASGASDRLDEVLTRIERVAADREQTDARRDWQLALSALEDAMQCPIGAGAAPLPDAPDRRIPSQPDAEAKR